MWSRAMERLFLPPDATEDGRNRASKLAEIRKDWNGLKDGPPVHLKPKQALTRIDMADLDAERPAPRISEIELEVVLTGNGFQDAVLECHLRYFQT